MEPIIHKMNIVLYSIILETSDWDSLESVYWGNESSKRWVIFLPLLASRHDEGLRHIFQTWICLISESSEAYSMLSKDNFQLSTIGGLFKMTVCLQSISISGKLQSYDEVNLIPLVRRVLCSFHFFCNWDHKHQSGFYCLQKSSVVQWLCVCPEPWLLIFRTYSKRGRFRFLVAYCFANDNYTCCPIMAQLPSTLSFQFVQ